MNKFEKNHSKIKTTLLALSTSKNRLRVGKVHDGNGIFHCVPCKAPITFLEARNIYQKSRTRFT